MSTPKSVTKINKNGVTYTSEVDKAEYYIYELTRAALRDTGKFIKREFRTRFYGEFRRITGKAGKVTYGKVYSGKSTTAPRLEIGLPHSKAGKTVEGFYAYFQEVGTEKLAKKQFLQKSVEENVSKIREIQSQYLSGLNKDDTQIEAMIDEKEIEIEDE